MGAVPGGQEHIRPFRIAVNYMKNNMLCVLHSKLVLTIYISGHPVPLKRAEIVDPSLSLCVFVCWRGVLVYIMIVILLKTNVRLYPSLLNFQVHQKHPTPFASNPDRSINVLFRIYFKSRFTLCYECSYNSPATISERLLV